MRPSIITYTVATAKLHPAKLRHVIRISNIYKSAKLNHNKKYREVRKEQNRLALLREKEAQNRRKLDQKHIELKVKERKRKKSSESREEPKKKLTDKQQKQKIAEDEATLRGEEDEGFLVKFSDCNIGEVIVVLKVCFDLALKIQGVVL